jgi:aspartyl-tRNA synthetase
MERFGIDKPDLRFGLELVGVDEWARSSSFNVFKDTIARGDRVIGIVVPAKYELSRKDIGALEESAKASGAKGLAYWKAGKDGGSGPLARFAAGEAGASLMQRMNATDGDLCLFVADKESLARRVLGELRLALGKRFELCKPGDWRFSWVTEFPMFEFDEGAGRWFSAHHPFTAPLDWTLGGDDPDLSKLGSRAYDLVLNGWELGSGSVRIHRSDVQQRVFSILGIGPEEQQKKFGFLLEALSFGAPPHAGFAVGLDRLTALSLGLDNIRDMVAFPKTTSASDLMCEAPSTVAPDQLTEVHIRTVVPPTSPRA